MVKRTTDVLQDAQIFGSIYWAPEGVNGAICLPSESISNFYETFTDLDQFNMNDLHLNVGEKFARSQKPIPFKKLLVKARHFILTDGT